MSLQGRLIAAGARPFLLGWACAAALAVPACAKVASPDKRPNVDGGSHQQLPASLERSGTSLDRAMVEELLLSARDSLGKPGEAGRAIELAERVLQIEPSRGDAFAILASQSLRDRDFERAGSTIQQGLANNPKHLELLSLRATLQFLVGDRAAFERSVTQVLEQDPRFGRIFRLTAEHAQAASRLEDAISLLRRAAALDSDDTSVRAELAIQLLRSGRSKEGRQLLELVAVKDPLDQRVRNTRILYQQIDRDYSTYRHGPFQLLLPQAHREPLRSTIAAWLDRANEYLQKRHGILDFAPILVELYGDQESFGVRTGGAPSTALEGACFGQTIVVRLPSDEPMNLGMALAHELSHVYHLRVSRNRVPRWFTEGLAEVETASLRPEWSREQELAVYVALRDGRLPPVAQFDRGFSRAANLEELALAYAASAYLVEYIQRRYGVPRITRMLRDWGRDKATAEVIAAVLSTDLAGLDRSFHDDLKRRLGHFDGQYLPSERAMTVDAARARSEANLDDSPARATLAIAELRRGQLATARQVIATIPVAQSEHPDLLWAKAMIDLVDQKPEPAEHALQQMLANGNDGYFVRMQLALVARMKAASARERTELLRAYHFHPTATEPLYRLAALAAATGDTTAELEATAALARLDESNPSVHRRLVELYVELGKPLEARAAGEALAYLTLLDASAHQLLARVAWLNRDPNGALRELRLARSLGGVDAERAMLDPAISNRAVGNPQARLSSAPRNR